MKCKCGKVSKIATPKPTKTSAEAGDEDGMMDMLRDMAAFEDEAEAVEMPKPPKKGGQPSTATTASSRNRFFGKRYC